MRLRGFLEGLGFRVSGLGFSLGFRFKRTEPKIPKKCDSKPIFTNPSLVAQVRAQGFRTPNPKP